MRIITNNSPSTTTTMKNNIGVKYSLHQVMGNSIMKIRIMLNFCWVNRVS